MIKTAVNLDQARKILRIAKQRTIKVPRTQQMMKDFMGRVERGEPITQPPLVQHAIMMGGGAPAAFSPKTMESIKAMEASGVSVPASVASAPNVQGKIVAAKGTDATGSLINSASISPVTADKLRVLTPQERIMHNAMVNSHELTEAAVPGVAWPPTPFQLATGHLSAQPPLNDSNFLASLPKEMSGVREAVKTYRPVEAQALSRATRRVGGRPGIRFGEQRLSRHARKKVGKRMEEIAAQGMQKQLYHPEHGPQLRQQLIQRGVPEVKGIGKLSVAMLVSFFREMDAIHVGHS